jgi:hypothetical protein
MLPDYYLPEMKPEPQPVLTFTQRKLGTKTEYEFQDDQLKFTLKTSSSTQTFFASYGSLDFKRVTDFIEQNEWLKNLGLLWMLLSAVFFMLRGPVHALGFLVLGGLAYGVGYMTKKTFSHIPADNCNVLVLKGPLHDEVVTALKEAERRYLRRYAGIYHEEAPDSAMHRFEALLKAGAINQDEYERLRSEALRLAQTELTEKTEQPRNLLN